MAVRLDELGLQFHRVPAVDEQAEVGFHDSRLARGFGTSTTTQGPAEHAQDGATAGKRAQQLFEVVLARHVFSQLVHENPRVENSSLPIFVVWHQLLSTAGENALNSVLFAGLFRPDGIPYLTEQRWLCFFKASSTGGPVF